jgi:hypothetical protein
MAGVTCPPIKLKTQNNNISLSGSGQVYFIKNLGEKGLWIDHPLKRHSASAGWSSYIRGGNWSALWVNGNDFALSCSVIQPGKVETLDCAHAISVCSPSESQAKSPGKGTYWLAEDKSWDEIVKAVGRRGIVIK